MRPAILAIAIIFGVAQAAMARGLILAPILYAAAPPALDGSVHANASNGATIAASLTTTNASDAIVAVITGNYTNSFSGAAIASVASTHTTGWVQRVDKVVSGNNFQHISEWWGKAAAALTSESITVTFSAGSGDTTFVTVDIFGVRGTAGPATSDANASVPTALNTVGGTPAVTTSHALDFVIGAMRMGSTASPTAGSGWTRISGANFQLVEYQRVRATGTYTATVGGGATDQNAEFADAVIH